MHTRTRSTLLLYLLSLLLVALDSRVSLAQTTGTASRTNSNVFAAGRTNTFLGVVDMGGATRTRPCRVGVGSPIGQNGTEGDCYNQTDATAGQRLWWATVTGTPATWTLQSGGSGGGDASTNTSTSVDSEVAVFSGTAGKTLKRATGTGAVKLTSGVIGIVSGTGTNCVHVDGTSAACPGGGVMSHPGNAQTGTTYTVLTGDLAKVVTHSNASPVAVTLPAAGGSFPDGWFYIAKNIGAGDVTITPTTSTIAGAANIVLSTGEFCLITSDGTNYEAECNRTVAGAGSTLTKQRTGVTVATDPALVGFFGNANNWNGGKQSYTKFGNIAALREVPTTAPSASLLTGDRYIDSSTFLQGIYNGSAFQMSPATTGTPCTATEVWIGSATSGLMGCKGTTGTGNAVLTSAPTINLPVIADFSNAAHNHGDAAGGGAIVTSALPVAHTRRVCDIGIGDTSGSAITNAQLGPQKRGCFIPAAATVIEVIVAADAGTPNVIVGRNVAGTQANIVSAALATAASGGIACSKTTAVTGIDGATTCSATLQNTALAAGSYLELVSGTAGGTAKWMTVHVVYTVD
jgi:hypothetical protein